jgi:hypothetical protein
MSQLKTGMDALMAMNKTIEEENLEHPPNTKVVKLRFTHKQYQTFRDACKMFEIVSSHPDFNSLVSKAFEADIKIPTIAKQIVTPIVEAPLHIPMKLPRKGNLNPSNRKESYFTAAVPVNDKVLKLYSKVANEVADTLRYDLKEGKNTCITDVRVMLSKYFSSMNLKNEQGTVVDDFLFELTPGSLNNNKDRMFNVDGQWLIPKGDTKVVTGIINEVTFDKF